MPINGTLGKGFEPPWHQSTSGFRDRRLRPSLATPATDIIVKSLIKPFFISLSIQVKIKIKIPRNKQLKEITIEKGSTVEDLLKKINIKPDTIIVMNKNQPIPSDDFLNEGQELTILHVSSGG